MKTSVRTSLTIILMATFGIVYAQEPVQRDQSQVAINELTTQLPRRAIKLRKNFPAFLKDAIKELARIAPEKAEVETLFKRVVVIADMDRYLDLKGATDSRQRESIKRFCVGFTVNQRWPIYINGESDLYTAAKDIELKNEQNPWIYVFAAALWHEMIHAEGQADEAVALAAEIELLETLYRRRLVELKWLNHRKVRLEQVRKGQVPDRPIALMTSKP